MSVLAKSSKNPIFSSKNCLNKTIWHNLHTLDTWHKQQWHGATRWLSMDIAIVFGNPKMGGGGPC